MDRPRINTFAYDEDRPNKIVVCKANFRSDPKPWTVWRHITMLGSYETHSEAMSAAVKLAHSWTGETPGELVQLREPLIFVTLEEQGPESYEIEVASFPNFKHSWTGVPLASEYRKE